MQSARRGVAGAGFSKAGRLFEVDNTQTATTAQALAGPRFEHMVERVHGFGPRSLAEMIVEIATATGQPALITDRLQAYAGLDPEIIRAFGGDRFPPSVLGMVR